MNDIDIIFKRLRFDLLRLKDPKLKNWSMNYFESHKKRYEIDIKLIRKYYSNGKIVEIGSIPCHLTYCLKKLHFDFVSVDINPSRAKSFIREHGLNVLKCDIESEKLPFEDNSVDLIIFSETFEHLRINPILTLRDINRILKPRGIIILTTPNIYFFKTFISYMFGKGLNDAYYEFEKLSAIGHMGHIRVYSKKEMLSFLNNAGFQIVKYSAQNYSKMNPMFMFFLRFFPYFCQHQVFICKK
ncbi:class I SAM-dependent methyltransferase [Candidatus Woesearchaeota archaeon]|nr:class I SAM-dependent methyltransferase [Candidatus Woesearchaeota archaeon]